MSYTWNVKEETVTITQPWGAVETVAWANFYAWKFVVEHLHINGKFTNLIDGSQFTKFYLMCDGFGKFATWNEYVEAVGAYDWSHVRDTNHETALEVAKAIASEVWDADFMEFAKLRIEEANAAKTNPINHIGMTHNYEIVEVKK